MKQKLSVFLSCALALSLTLHTPAYASAISPEAAYAAQWTANAVKITFNSNGGGVAPGEQIYTYGIERSLPNVCAMQKTGYTFAGWALSSSATEPDCLPGATSSTAFGYADATKAIAKTLYAVWKLDDTTTILSKLESLETRLAAVESNTSSIKSTVNTMSASGGVVKSVQRGFTNVSWNNSANGEYSAIVNINSVNVSKSSINVYPVVFGRGASSSIREIMSYYAEFTNSNTIKITCDFCNGASTCPYRIGWEVIEYY